ncbi:MAG: Do family serine endopeptidase [Kofleriaceae bacterium]|nr:Do family serine endopeptidase [Kofleriaceae bacterium]
MRLSCLTLPALALALAAAPACESSHRAPAASTVAAPRPDARPTPVAAPLPPLPGGLPAAGFAGLVAQVSPSVVSIIADIKTEPTAHFGFNPFGGVDPFGGGDANPFGMEAPHQRGEGSGVIVSADGYILTNNHVVDHATQLTVTTSEGRDLAAKVIGTDPHTDLAVIKVDATGLPAATLGDSDRLRVGDYAIAIGSPFGLTQTVTLGIVSAMGRNGMGLADYEDFIQTDAAINPGNSGGALVDTAGEVIGINTAIVSHGAPGNQGVGFAVPSNIARDVMKQLIDHGKVVRGYLGVAIQDVTPALADAMKLGARRGALIGDVEPDSPAAKAGLQRGDVVTSIDGRAVDDSHQLRLRVSRLEPGTKVALAVTRAGADRSVDVTLGALPGQDEGDAHADGKPQGWGIQLGDLTADRAAQVGAPAGTEGALIGTVAPGSRAEDAGLRAGDVLLEVDQAPVKSATQAQRALADHDHAHVLLVMSRGQTHYVALAPR